MYNELLTISETAEYLKVYDKTVRRLIQNKRTCCVKGW
jgi:excisionase family DNA binding protein